MLKHDVTSEPDAENPDAPPGEDDANDVVVRFYINGL